ncbi:PREDICTED: uncharacterized protein LOC104710934 [Camelina sativa]|uniref:Uncharacterized protein LOC104710934 n=1 Tax=Camelina sativa TaxID=90675 RepID=A0ABM0TG31_CAMSA|nr:PREDICTED: uncharacterized protein LOC104710934 [Camelina sativa]
MQEIPSNILILVLLLFFLNFSPSTQNPQQQEEGIYYCGNTPIPYPSNLITCRSGDLYFKTSTGLSHVSGTEEVRLRARVSMEVEGRIPDLCIACERPDGNCGVALRCLCHPKECKNKVVNFGTKSRALSGNTQQLLPFVSMALFLMCF